MFNELILNRRYVKYNFYLKLMSQTIVDPEICQVTNGNNEVTSFIGKNENTDKLISCCVSRYITHTWRGVIAVKLVGHKTPLTVTCLHLQEVSLAGSARE
jgi:hypothetical protein